MASAAAARSTAAVAARAAAARHVASGTGRSSPLFPRHGFAAVTTTTTLPAAWTRPLPSHAAAAAAAPMPSATRLVRRGLAKISDNYFYHESLNYVPLCWVDPDAPVDPATHFSHGEEDLASEEAMWALYERWCAFYGVKRSRDDMLRRFGAFKEMARRIHEFNKSGASYTMKLGERADLTAEERDRCVSRSGTNQPEALSIEHQVSSEQTATTTKAKGKKSAAATNAKGRQKAVAANAKGRHKLL